MNINKYIYITLLLCMALYGCKQEEYKVIIPMSGITLSQPEDGLTIDLNDETATAYSFAWNEVSEGGNTLVLSASPYLLEPITIDVGDASSFSITPEQMDQYFSEFGIGSGGSSTIYWSVKPTKQLSVAATEIRSFEGTRMRMKLNEPADQFIVALNGENPEESLYFSWNIEGHAEDAAFSLVFGDKPDFTGKSVQITVGATNAAYITHEQLQGVLDEMGVKKYSTDRLYWNVLEQSTGKQLSRTSAVLFMKGMMILIDTRGDETIRYKVTRLNFSDGTSQVWLAENLRATRYPDGSPIDASQINFAPASMGEDYVKAYGAYYSENVKKDIAPAGWRLPTTAEFEELFYQASIVPGTWNVLKDDVYYENFNRDAGHVNEWGLSLVSAGQWSGGAVTNHKGVYCYLHVADCEPWKCVLHDNGGTLWWPWTDAATARFIYNE